MICPTCNCECIPDSIIEPYEDPGVDYNTASAFNTVASYEGSYQQSSSNTVYGETCPKCSIFFKNGAPYPVTPSDSIPTGYCFPSSNSLEFNPPTCHSPLSDNTKIKPDNKFAILIILAIISYGLLWYFANHRDELFLAYPGFIFCLTIIFEIVGAIFLLFCLVMFAYFMIA